MPELAEVLTPGERLVGSDDGITCVEERRAAWLKLHAVEDELDDKGVAVLGDERLGIALRIVLACPVEVALGDRTILKGLGREEVVDEAVLLDQALRDDPQHLRPDLANGVHAPVTGLVKCLVGRWVDSLVQRVGVVADALLDVRCPRTHGVVGVDLVAADGRSQEVCGSSER